VAFLKLMSGIEGILTEAKAKEPVAVSCFDVPTGCIKADSFY
jgi:hypothetical protein